VTDQLDQPIAAAALPGDDRLFVVEKTGKIRILRDGTLLTEPFLDLSRDVTSEGSEQGLTTLAFHPRFEDNGRAFVFYTDVNGTSQLAEYRLDPDDANRLDPATRLGLLSLEQPHPAHQAGALAFGPDGYLWVTLGDGGIGQGASGDPWGHGQNPETLYGTIIRVDIDAARPYAIPPDNPFVDGEDGAREVWAYGLRNPWRMTMDLDSGLLYLTDVGHEKWEEINIVRLDTKGANYGWSIEEGPQCFEADACGDEGLVAPAHFYNHGSGCAIVGGPVYRGTTIPEIEGHYFYADYCLGWIHSLRTEDGRVVEDIDWTVDLGRIGNVTSFAVDGHREMYVMTLAGELFAFGAARD
jgi:glucose/arabinose dehydrogenase